MRAIFAALVLMMCALFQGPPRDSRTPVAAPSGSGVIRGRVVAADTGAPIRGALVTIATRGMVLTIYTDARGRYELRDLAPGSYSLRAEPNQHQGQFFSLNLTPASATVPLQRVAVVDGQISEAEALVTTAQATDPALSNRATDPTKVVDGPPGDHPPKVVDSSPSGASGLNSEASG